MKTVLISKSEVPTYLQSGEFHKSLSDDQDHEQFTVPKNTLKADTTVLNNADLLHLLTSLRYWGVSSVQEEVIKYCLSELESPCDVILLEFVQDFPYVEVLISVLLARKEDKLMMAVTSGILEIVRNLPGNLVVDFYCCSAAAQAGNLEILQCLHERGGVLNSFTLHTAVEGGDKCLTCVQYLRAQGVGWLKDAHITSLKAGSKECFHYALQDGCTWSVQYIDNAFCEDQHVEALKYAILHGCPINYASTVEAARNGAIQCLRVLHEANCPLNACASQAAAYAGHLDCLKYLHENNYPWHTDTLFWAVKNDLIEFVQYALQQDYPVSSYSCYVAAEYGNLPILQCLHEAGVPWIAYTCESAAANGHLHCLQYAHEHGCPWDEKTFRSTLASGHLERLKYLLENGCPIDMKQCNEIIQRGRCYQEAVEMFRSFHPNLL